MEGMVVMFGTDARLGQGHGARAELFAMADVPRTVLLDDARMQEACGLLTLMGHSHGIGYPPIGTI